MAQRVFILDVERCFGCHGCTAACANANGTPAGIMWREVLKLPPHEGSSSTRWLSLSCNHCAEPPCVAACPSGALSKRESDGVVLHEAGSCLGCRYCQMACPYDAIRWDENSGLVSKCDFCHERLDRGLEPACVETCFAGALTQVLLEGGVGAPGRYSIEVPGFRSLAQVKPSILFAGG